MTDRISAKQFRDAGGVEDWRTIFGGGWACAYFRTGSFAAGVELVRAIGEVAAAANHHPDVELRPEGVSVKLFTSEFGGLGEQ
ncbi:MAG TPA: 4a-hydroxytetrahydrobiopterin dehydratase, partial [Actinospica sp.]|nr:4a-hydroxytetrahydrobiopterin dehydratase [Actinospica sp.]